MFERNLRWAAHFAILICMVLGLSGYGNFAHAQDNAPIELVYGQTVEGSVSADSPSMFYQFEAHQGDLITATMLATGGDLDPFLVLNGADGIPLTTDDNSGGGTNARLLYEIEASGVFTLQATHAGGIPSGEGGTFSLNLTASLSESIPPTAEQAGSSPGVVQGPRINRLEPGTTILGKLDRENATRFYWFEADQDQQIIASLTQRDGVYPLLSLLDDTLTPVAQSEDTESLIYSTSDAGIYFLVVGFPSTSDALADYSLNLNIGNPSSTGDFTTITYGGRASGTLDSSAYGMTYAFRGSEGDNITITMSRAGGNLDSYLYLLDTNATTLYEDNDSGGDNGDARITYSLPEDGQYLIIATRMGEAEGTTSGSYLLELLSDSPPPSTEEQPSNEPSIPEIYEAAPQLAYGESVEGEISSEKYLDLYTFYGQEGETILAEMQSLNADDINGLDPLLVLLDDQQIPLLENDDIVEGEIRDSQLTFTLPKTGYYALVATRFEQADGTSSGPYSLTLKTNANEVPAPTAGALVLQQITTRPIQSGVPLQGAFSPGGTLYRFMVNEPTFVDISLTADEGLDATIMVVNSDLVELASASSSSLENVSLPAEGNYAVLIAPRFGPTNFQDGGYILAITLAGEEGSPEESTDTETLPNGPEPIAYNQSISGVIDDNTPALRYVFTGAAGEYLRIRMSAAAGSGLDCYLELATIDGQIIEFNDDIDPGIIRDSRIVAELPADGAYIIVASRYEGPDAPTTEGAFDLTLEQVDEQTLGVSSDVVPIEYGQTITNTIDDDQYLLFYVFEGEANDVISIEIEHLSGNLDTVLFLYRSEGDGWVELASNDDSPTGGTYEAYLDNVTLPQTGKYLIAVSRYGLQGENYFGDFRIMLIKD